MTTLADAIGTFSGAVESRLNDFNRTARSQGEDLKHIKSLLETEHKLESKDDAEYRADFLKCVLNANAVKPKRKDVSLHSQAAGGMAMPKAVESAIYAYARTLNPWLDPDILGVKMIPQRDYREPLGLADVAASRSDETSSRTDTGTARFRERTPAWGEYYCYCTVGNWAANDIPGLEAYMVREFGTQIAAQLASDIFAGSGTSGQVKGLVYSAPVSTTDAASPLRSADVIQYVPLSGASSPISSTFTFKDVAKLLGEFSEAYLEDPSFAIVMRRSSFRALVMTEAPKEAPLLMSRQPSLFGVPVRFTSAVHALGSNNYPVVAGAWKQAYTLVSPDSFNLILDQVTTPGYTKWRSEQRFGGNIRNNNAAKALKQALS